MLFLKIFVFDQVTVLKLSQLYYHSFSQIPLLWVVVYMAPGGEVHAISLLLLDLSAPGKKICQGTV